MGYYSTYGISKCLSASDFEISIKELEDNVEESYNLTEVTGKFISKDLSEVPVKYEFNVYNNNELIESSGVLIHNNSQTIMDEITSISRIFYDTFKITSELEDFETY